MPLPSMNIVCLRCAILLIMEGSAEGAIVLLGDVSRKQVLLALPDALEASERLLRPSPCQCTTSMMKHLRPTEVHPCSAAVRLAPVCTQTISQLLIQGDPLSPLRAGMRGKGVPTFWRRQVLHAAVPIQSSPHSLAKSRRVRCHPELTPGACSLALGGCDWAMWGQVRTAPGAKHCVGAAIHQTFQSSKCRCLLRTCQAATICTGRILRFCSALACTLVVLWQYSEISWCGRQVGQALAPKQADVPGQLLSELPSEQMEARLTPRIHASSNLVATPVRQPEVDCI